MNVSTSAVGASSQVDVVGDQQHRLVGGDVGEEVEGRETDQEDHGHAGIEEAEGGQQRLPLGRRQSLGARQHRTEQLVEAGEGRVRLAVPAGDREDPAAAGTGGTCGGVEKGGLPDARIAADQQGAAVLREIAQPPVQERDLAVAPVEQLRAHASPIVVCTVTDAVRLRWVDEASGGRGARWEGTWRSPSEVPRLLWWGAAPVL
jgi:hypothetical protein